MQKFLLLSTGWEYKSVPDVRKRACNVHVFQPSFHLAHHHWWLGRGWENIHPTPVFPTSNALLISFCLSSDAENFVTNHRPSMRIGAGCAKNVHCATCTYSNRASILHATIGGRADTSSLTFSRKNFFFYSHKLDPFLRGRSHKLLSFPHFGHFFKKKELFLSYS